MHPPPPLCDIHSMKNWASWEALRSDVSRTGWHPRAQYERSSSSSSFLLLLLLHKNFPSRSAGAVAAADSGRRARGRVASWDALRSDVLRTGWHIRAQYKCSSSSSSFLLLLLKNSPLAMLGARRRRTAGGGRPHEWPPGRPSGVTSYAKGGTSLQHMYGRRRRRRRSSSSSSSKRSPRSDGGAAAADSGRRARGRVASWEGQRSDVLRRGRRLRATYVCSSPSSSSSSFLLILLKNFPLAVMGARRRRTAGGGRAREWPPGGHSGVTSYAQGETSVQRRIPPQEGLMRPTG